LAGIANESAGKIMGEFNETLPTMRALRFTVKDLRAATDTAW
jgi:hypothetical protein